MRWTALVGIVALGACSEAEPVDLATADGPALQRFCFIGLGEADGLNRDLARLSYRTGAEARRIPNTDPIELSCPMENRDGLRLSLVINVTCDDPDNMD